MSNIDTIVIDDAADTLRFAPLDPDATSIYDISSSYGRRIDHASARRRLILRTRHDVARLREAVAAGWDVGPELAFEERRLAALEARPA